MKRKRKESDTTTCKGLERTYIMRLGTHEAMWEAFKDMREERINNKLNKKRFNVAPEFLRMRPDKFLEIINSHENE